MIPDVPGCSAPAPAVTGLSSMAMRRLLAEALDGWRAAGGPAVRIDSIGGEDAVRRLIDGLQVDLVVLAADSIDRLAAAGRLLPDTAMNLAVSPLAAAVRAQDALPDLAHEAGLRAALLGARAIGLSTGPSGRAVRVLLEAWGLAAPLRSRLVQAPPGVPVASLLLGGEVDLGFQQRSELSGIGGLVLAEPLFPAAGFLTLFRGAVLQGARDAQAARRVLRHLASPALDPLRRRHGLDSLPPADTP